MNSTVPAEPVERSRPDTASLAGLGNRFLELFARRLPREEFAAEVARLVGEAVRVRVVATLAYDSRTDQLTLLADLGLSPEARAALGGGSECSWDIPLRGLHNRRISVIAAAQQNPFVPRALTTLAPRGLTIASVPILYELQPVGVLLLFAAGNRNFPDSQLQMLSQALRVCARGLRLFEAPPMRPSPLAGSESAEEVIFRLIREGAVIEASELPEAADEPQPSWAEPTEGHRITPGDQALARQRKLEEQLVVARGELARNQEALRSLSASYGRVARERDGLAQELAQFEAARDAAMAEMQAQVETLEQRLLAVDSERSRHQRKLSALESERDTLRERTHSAEASAAELQTAMATERQERERLATEVHTLVSHGRAAEEALAAARAEHAALQDERDRRGQEAAALQTEVVARAARLVAVEQELQETISARDQTAGALQAAHAELQHWANVRGTLTQRIAELEDVAAQASTENSTLRQTLLDQQADRQRTEEALRAERDGARQEAERRADEAAAHRAQLADGVRMLATQGEEIAVLRQAQESARQAEVTWQQTTAALRAELETIGAGLEHSAAEQQVLRDECQRLDAALTAARAQAATDIAALRQDRDALAAERQQIAQEEERQRAEGHTLAARLAAVEERAAELSVANEQRGRALTAVTAARDEALARVSALTAAAATERKQLERERKRSAREGAALAAERDDWKQRAERAYAEVAQRVENLTAVQQERDAARQVRDALQGELQTLQTSLDDLSAEMAKLRGSAQEVDSARAAALQEAAADRRALSEERAARARSEQALRGDLETATAEADRQRDEMTGLRAEVETLTAERTQRQMLETRAAGLTARITDLEQQVTAAAAAADAWKQQHAELTAALDAAQEQVAAGARARAALDTELRGLQDERDQARSERVTLEATLAAVRAELTASGSEVERLAGEVQRVQHAAAEQAAERATTAQALAELQHHAAARDAEVDALQRRLQDSAAEIAQLREERAAIEQQLNVVAAARGEETQTLAQALQAAREHVVELERERTTLRATLDEARERARLADQAETTARVAEDEVRGLQAQIESLVAERAASDAQWQQHLEATRGELRDSTDAGAALRDRLAHRDAELAGLQNELQTLRDQTADRGKMADHARALGQRVQALELELRQQHDAATHAEQQRRALSAELETVRVQQTEAAAAAARQQDELRESVEGLTQERARLQAEAAAQRATQAETVATLAALRAEQAQLLTVHGEATQRLAAALQQVEQLTASVRQRDAALTTAANERQRAAQQVADLNAQVRAAQQAAAATETRTAAERTEAEAERDRWIEEARAARAEADRLAVTHDELDTAVARLQHEHAAVREEAVALRDTLEQERGARVQVEQQLRSELATLHAALDRARQEADEVRQASSAQAESAEALADWQRRAGALEVEMATLRARADDSAAECAQLREARTVLERQLTTVAATRGEEAQTLAQGLQAAREQVVQLEQESATLRTALNDLRTRATQAENTQLATRAALQAELDAAHADAQRWKTGAEEAAAAGAAAAATAVAEQQRTAALALRQQELEAQLTATAKERAVVEAALARAQAEIESQRQHGVDHDALLGRIHELTARLETVEDERRVLHAAAAEAERQRLALAADLEAERQQHAQAAAAATREQESLLAALERLSQEHGRLEAERVAQRGELQAQRAAQDEVSATLEQLRAEQEQLDADRHDVAQRLAGAHRQLDELSTLLQQRDAALASAVSERQRLEDTLSAAEATATQIAAERDAMHEQLEEALARARKDTRPAADATARLGSDFVVQAETAPTAADQARQAQMMRREERSELAIDAPLVIERSAPLGAVLDDVDEIVEEETAAAEAEVADTGPVGELVLLDAGPRGDEAEAVLGNAGFTVVRAPVVDATVDELALRKVSCVLLNLAGGPGAWQTLRLLRERSGTRNIPVLAYLMLPQAQKGFCFGRADFGVWPMDPERIIDRLAVLKPKLKRLLAVSADVDTTGRIREPLAKEGISTSIVLDGKQALELAGIVAPEAALVHLSPQCPSCARAVAGLRSGASTRDMPLLVLLEKNPPREDAFYAGSMRDLIAKPNFLFANLPAELAALLS
jgi:chromosome segregation ATPase/CheY-like chemotaxis protein